MRRKLTLLLLILLLLFVAGGTLLWLRLAESLNAQGIQELDWDGLNLGVSASSLNRLSVIRQAEDGSRLDLTAYDIRITHLQWFSGMTPQQVDIARLEVAWWPSLAEPRTEATAIPRLDELARPLAYLPEQLDIAHFKAALPCPAGRCSLTGSLAWARDANDKGAELTLTLRDNLHQATLEASADYHGPDAEVLIRLLADGNPRLVSRHWLSEQDARLLWRGSVALGELPEAPWLMQLLQPWTSFALAAPLQAPTAMRLGASWSVQIPRTTTEQMAGHLAAALHLPEPWPVPGLGLLEGDLQLAAETRQGGWSPTGAKGMLTLQPEPAPVAFLPLSLRPERLILVVDPTQQAPLSAAARLDVTLTLEGKARATLNAKSVSVGWPLRLDAPDTRLDIRAPDVSFAQIGAKGLKGQMRFKARYEEDTLELTGQRGSLVHLQSLATADYPDLALHGLTLEADRLQLKARFTQNEAPRWSVNAKPTVSTTRLQHPGLTTQGWRWSGEINAGGQQMLVAGKLTNDAGLSVQTRGTWQPTALASLLLQLEDVSLSAGNALEGSFSAWPPLLSFNQGRLQAEARLRLPTGGIPAANLTLSLAEGAGIYDLSEFAELDLQTQLALNAEWLRVDLERLRIGRINPGIPLGPLTLEGHYQAPRASPADGTLSWQTAQLDALGGKLKLAPGQQRLSGETPPQQVTLRGLELGPLLTAYPAEGLSGEGTLDGEMTMRLNTDGLRIDQGQLAARAPGTLRFDSPRLAALAAANPAMSLVSKALKNFRYERLESDIHYDEQGLLQLGVRLHGHNPELEGGRPIHFNINLEEDVPALLTSLQLSDRVSETIRRRVQERLHERAATPTQ